MCFIFLLHFSNHVIHFALIVYFERDEKWARGIGERGMRRECGGKGGRAVIAYKSQEALSFNHSSIPSSRMPHKNPEFVSVGTSPFVLFPSKSFESSLRCETGRERGRRAAGKIVGGQNLHRECDAAPLHYLQRKSVHQILRSCLDRCWMHGLTRTNRGNLLTWCS